MADRRVVQAVQAPRGLDRFGQFTSRRELAALESHLAPDEAVVHAVEARRAGKQGLLVCTKARILWLARGLVGHEVATWGQETFDRVRVEPDGAYARILLDGDEDLAFDFVSRERADAFALAVKSLHSGAAFRQARPVRDPAKVTPRAPAPLSDLEKRLVRMEEMRRAGSLTDDEYAYARRHLLESLGLPGDLPAPETSRATQKARAPPPPWLGEKRVAGARQREGGPAAPPTSWPGEERVERAKAGKPTPPPVHGDNVSRAPAAEPRSKTQERHLEATSRAAGASLAKGHERTPAPAPRGPPADEAPSTLGNVHGGRGGPGQTRVAAREEAKASKPAFPMPDAAPAPAEEPAKKPVTFTRTDGGKPGTGPPKTFKITKQPPKGK